MAEKGKIGKNARVAGLMNRGGEQTATIENDSSRGKVFVEVKKLLSEASIGFQNLSSSHPIIINKGSFSDAINVIKPALCDGDGGRYIVEKEDNGQLVLVENTKKDPTKMVVRESPFSWQTAG